MENKIKFKEISVNDANLKKYKQQTNIIKQSGESNLNYGHIKIMTDMDPDGSNIECLLIQFLSLWPDLFSQNRVSRLITPLFIARKDKKPTQYFYTFDEYENTKDKLNGYEIDYIKGLGSLENEDYKKTVIDNPKEIIITLDSLYKDNLSKIFSKDPEPRKEWLMNAE